jgi:hypothetical protein
MKMHTRLLGGIVLAAGLALFGCGDDGGDDGGGGMGDSPTADFTANPDCTSSAATEITFTSTSSDTEDGTDLDCSWSFESGTPGSSTQCTVTGVTFPHVRPYQVVLTVTDSDDNTDSFSINIPKCPGT